MKELRRLAVQPSRPSGKAGHSMFFGSFLPLGLLVTLILGIVILAPLRPAGWTAWLLAATGAFCCFVAGWLAAAALSKSYWNHAMTQQVAVWRRIADAFFDWLEEAPVPAEALSGLRRTLYEAVPSRDLDSA